MYMAYVRCVFWPAELQIRTEDTINKCQNIQLHDSMSLNKPFKPT